VKKKKIMHKGIRWWTALWLIACFALSFHSPAEPAQETAKAKKETKKGGDGALFEANKKDPILISAERMEVDRKKASISYKGKVVAVQGEMTMKSDSLTAHYTAPDMKELKEIVADGKVHVTQGDRVATGAKAVFNGQNQTLSLIGNALVRQGNSEVSGSRIVFYIEKDLVVAEGGNDRVKSKIFPEELKKRDKEEDRTGKGS
jgi:lipopolysaccharide export system protein LptA